MRNYNYNRYILFITVERFVWNNFRGTVHRQLLEVYWKQKHLVLHSQKSGKLTRIGNAHENWLKYVYVITYITNNGRSIPHSGFPKVGLSKIFCTRNIHVIVKTQTSKHFLFHLCGSKRKAKKLISAPDRRESLLIINSIINASSAIKFPTIHMRAAPKTCSTRSEIKRLLILSPEDKLQSSLNLTPVNIEEFVFNIFSS